MQVSLDWLEFKRLKILPFPFKHINERVALPMLLVLGALALMAKTPSVIKDKFSHSQF